MSDLSEAPASSRSPTTIVGAGLDPLAVLPVFVRLRGRRAVVAGTGAGVLWKARLLSAAGAEVHVFGPGFAPDLRLDPVDGPIVLHERDWRPDDLDGAAFAIAGLEDETSCSDFARCARERGAIVNAIDRPDLCEVQFGAVVNRSPLVVGISTDGAAPILAQRVRSEIEALLPSGLAAWLTAAAGWRARVREAFATMRDRRTFWQLFTGRAFEHPEHRPTLDDFDQFVAAARGASVGRGGSVALVGAGPGDPELLTLKAVRALRTADVVLYDDLVAPGILAFARREARTMLVGKTGNGPSCRQDEINTLMVGLAERGRRVVRLKGGDPLIFGRAAEEIEACRGAGIPVEIVPGISAAQGAAASIGAPLTNRYGSRRVQFVTAHDHKGELPDLDWPALADATATTAIYMPRGRLRVLLERALAAGLPPRTPAAAIVNGTRPDQEILEAEVAELADRVEDLSSDGPMLVLVGETLRAAAGAGARSGEGMAATARASR